MKTILITGVSSGLGLAIAEEALARGHRVVGTLRQEEQRVVFEAKAPGRSIGRLLDVVDTAAISPLVAAVEEAFGGIDVLVNNAGYGLRGYTEELDLDALRRQFEVNLFGPVALIQAVLPGMRKHGAGHIVNMASMGGMVTFPGLGAYHGTKFALLGMSDALRKEVASFGIKVTSVLPGVYRSDWGGRSQVRTKPRESAYPEQPSSSADFSWGDPRALGRVVLSAIEMEQPPERLLVGPTAIRMVRDTIQHWSSQIDHWEMLSEADGQG